MSDQPLLRIKGLEVQAPGEVCLLDGVELSLQAGEILALVGESGCGKTLTALATLGLLPSGLRCTGGRILFQGRDLLAQGEAGFASVRGCGIGVVFQQPGASLHPGLRVGDQLARIIRHHRGGSRQEAREAALRWLARLTRMDRLFRLDVFPLVLSAPWGLTVGPLPVYLPYPSRILIEVLEPIAFERTGAEAARDEVYVLRCAQQVESTMQSALERLAAERQKQG